MTFLSTIILALSMSADAFAASISKGIMLQRPRLRQALFIGFIFGAVETITPIIGWGVGQFASQFIADIDHWIAFTLLGVIGTKMIKESLHAERPAKKENHHIGILILTAIGTSIDAMIVGVTLALMDVNIFAVALAIGSATFVMSTIGIMAGHYIGLKAGRVAEALGGAGLILIGTGILAEHLGLLPH